LLWPRVNFHSGEPVYQQIVDHITTSIISGKLAADREMPSIREMARVLQVNPNTVARAYRELEQRGYIYSRPGIGSFVRGHHPDSVEQKVLDMIGEELNTTIKKAHNYNLSREKLARLFEEHLGKIFGGED